jgi:Fe-S-cluster containining protein
MSDAPSPIEGEAEGPGRLSDASTLCVGCGMCCNGVLFTNARAEPDEVPRLRELGLEVEQVRGDRLQFRLPCPHHDDGHCGIYADRFLKCRTFRCALLKRLDSGETSLAEAEAAVAQAKAMLARVTALDPAAGQFRTRLEQRTAPPPEEGEDVTLRRRLLIESLALDLFFDRKFRNRKAVDMRPSPGKSDQEER